jgi:hypothetical protein
MESDVNISKNGIANDNIDSKTTREPDQPSGKSAIATQVAEFALLTPVATQSSTSPVKIWSPKWNTSFSSGFDNSSLCIPPSVSTSCNSIPTSWQTSDLHPTSSLNTRTHDINQNKSSVFFGGISSTKFSNNCTRNERSGANYSDVPSGQNFHISDETGMLRQLEYSLGASSTHVNSPRSIFQTIGSNMLVGGLPNYVPPSHFSNTSQHSEPYQTMVGQFPASYSFLGNQGNNSGFDYSAGDNLQVPLYMPNSWSDIYQF